ncbi:MAG: hypothetical protein ACPKPY_02560 [Nitrososphaeraceae archaeon]
MEIVKIKAYKFEELKDEAIIKALTWLDNFPLDYEDENGNIKWEYFSDIHYNDSEYVAEHCEANEYLFDEYGNIIHHLIQK